MMSFAILILIGLTGSSILGALWLMLVSPGGPPDKLRVWHILGGLPTLVLTIIWSIAFIVHPVEYEAKAYYSDSSKQGIDYIYTDGQRHINLNQLFGKRVKPNTIMTETKEKPYLGLVWSEKSDYLLQKDK